MDPLGDEFRRELRRFGPQAGIGDAVEEWPAAVGEEIARNAWPARITRDGTLVVHARDSVWAYELTQRAGDIAQRLSMVKSVKFVPGPVPEREVEPTQATAPQSPPPTSEDRRRAAQWSSQIEDEALRKIVQRAIENALAKAANDRSF